MLINGNKISILIRLCQANDYEQLNSFYVKDYSSSSVDYLIKNKSNKHIRSPPSL